MSRKQSDDASEDGKCSPECLLTSEPVKDPYSTDEEKERCRKIEDNGGVAKSSSSYTSVTYNGSSVTLQSLKRYFDILYYPILPGPGSDELEKMDIPEILDHILNFVTNRQDMKSRTIMADLLSYPERATHVLYQDKDFHINFKEPGWTSLPEVEKNSSTPYRLACNFMRKLSKVLLVTGETLAVESKYQHDTVKAFMTAFCSLNVEYVWEKEECVTLMQSTKESRKTGKLQTVSFKSHPDLVLDSASKDSQCPGIPFEIYSPIKKLEGGRPETISTRNKSKKGSDSMSTYFSSDTDSTVTDAEAKKPLATFLADNVPVFMFEKCKNCESNFKNKLAAQHILQVIGVASNFCYEKYRRAIGELQKSKCFVGFLVSNEYVYLSKVQGDEKTFAKYHENYQSRKVRPNQMEVWLSGGSVCDPNIHVQFSSMVFDLSNHNHRVALLLFLQYYLDNWDKIQEDCIRNIKIR